MNKVVFNSLEAFGIAWKKERGIDVDTMIAEKISEKFVLRGQIGTEPSTKGYIDDLYHSLGFKCPWVTPEEYHLIMSCLPRRL